MGHNFGTFFSKNPTTKFVVKNIAPGNKRIRIFQQPIRNGETRDLLAMPGLSEADIRHSLLKGELLVKLKAGEIVVVESDIDLLQYNNDQRNFLIDHGVVVGTDVSTSIGGGGVGVTSDNHKTLRQLIHLADAEGPMEEFSGAYRETLPFGNPFPTSIIWWENSSKLRKIVEKTITRDGEQNPTTIVMKVYDEFGLLLATATDTITYSGPFETTRTRTIL